jgi:hypothetical protein
MCVRDYQRERERERERERKREREREREKTYRDQARTYDKAIVTPGSLAHHIIVV